MPEPQTPATPQAGDPGASTPTPGGSPTPTPEPQAGDGDIQISLEEARKLRSEAANLRKREKEVLAQLKVYQDAEQQAKDAQLPEIERLKKVAADLQEQNETIAAKLLESNVRQDVADKAGKFHFAVSAKTLANLLLHDFEAIEFDDATGEPTNIEKLLDKLAKSEPDLVKKEQQQQGAPALPGMNPGRSSIQPPGGRIPGKIPTLDDIEWKR